jgi:putative peptide maturation system protein
MNDNPFTGWDSILEYLVALHREGVRPPVARARLRQLQAQYPDTRLELVWEEEVYDGSVHYDILVHRIGQGTISMSVSPEQALPWPLRGLVKWSDKDIVRVNNVSLRVHDAIALLDFIWEEAPLVNRLLNVCLIHEALEQEPIELSDAEMQRALDAFRRTHKLYTAPETYRWMERLGITREKLERLVADEATVAKLRNRVTARQVEAHFQTHRADFDCARVARLHFPDETSAQRALVEVRGGRLDFYVEAERRFREAAQPTSGQSQELFAVVERRQACPSLGRALFAAAPGDLIGPVSTPNGYTVLRVLSITPARLDETTFAGIQKILFEDWLEKRRRAAKIEWYWGNAAGTSAATAG